MIPSVPPITVSRPLLFGLLAVGAVVAVAAPQPTSSFAAGLCGRGRVRVRALVPEDAAAAALGRERERSRAMKVFVVEDEQRISQFLKKGLTEKGYAVDVAADSDTALDRIVAAARPTSSSSTSCCRARATGSSSAGSCAPAASARRSSC